MHGCRKEERKDEKRDRVWARASWRPARSLGLRDSRRAFLLSVVMPNTVLRASRNWGRRELSGEDFSS